VKGALVVALALPAIGAAQGINTNVALPVAKGEGIWRSQLRATVSTDDPSVMEREVHDLVLLQTLVIGVTPRLTGFATLPMLALRRTEVGSSRRRDAPAFGDLTLLGRYMVFVDDYAPLSTRRVAVLGGIKLPTGADRFGTPSYDPILGVVGTWAANRHELDVDALFRLTTERRQFEAGDRLRYDVAYRYRLWPERFGSGLAQLNGILELNGSWTGRTEEGGGTLRDSGGNVLLIAPGFQLVTNRLILEASLQLPLAQDLRGSQLETDLIGVISVRVPFSLD